MYVQQFSICGYSQGVYPSALISFSLNSCAFCLAQGACDQCFEYCFQQLIDSNTVFGSHSVIYPILSMIYFSADQVQSLPFE